MDSCPLSLIASLSLSSFQTVLDPTRRMMTTAATLLSTAVAAGKEGDQDVEEGHDSVDDSGQDRADTIDNGHQAVTDGAENVSNLLEGEIC
jgi:hypothetical protein